MPKQIGIPDVSPAAISQGYLDVLARIESSGRPYVKASTSSASGLYQFIKGTWERMGGAWGPDPTKAFGGLKPTKAEQDARAAAFTAANAAALRGASLPITNSTLYAAHFLGATAALRVLRAPLETPLANVLSAAVIRANPHLARMDVRAFLAWLNRKTGG